MAIHVVSVAHSECFRRGQIVEIAGRKLVVRKILPGIGLQLKPARWYHFLLYKFAHAIAKRNKERQ